MPVSGATSQSSTNARVTPSDEARDRCHAVLRNNWREGEFDGVRFAYTAPSPHRYPWQWYWDSCFTAVARRRLDPDGSRRELESLLAAQAADGFIGHTIFWGRPLTGVRRLFYTVRAQGDAMTATIQPPLLAWCWRIAVGDPSDVPAIAAHHAWLCAERDLDGDGLLWLIEPDESGLDASPQFDPVWGWRGAGELGFPLLVRRNRRLGFSLARVVASGGPVACEVMTNVAHALSTLALGRPSITPRLVERLYDERQGLFRTEFRPAPMGRVPVAWSALAPLALPDLPEPIGRRLVEEHLLDEDEFMTPVAPPSVAASEASYEPGGHRGPVRRYWRGPTWVNSAWLLWLGLRRLGYADEAARLARGVIGAVEREGLREYYDPRSGTGLGAVDFAWSALVAELAICSKT